MKRVTYTGPAGNLKVGDKIYPRGQAVEVSNADADAARKGTRPDRLTIEDVPEPQKGAKSGAKQSVKKETTDE